MNETDNTSRGDVHGAVGSYVVHALEEPELSQFEAHVAGCGKCSNEITSFNEMLAQLSADFEVAPPAELRGSVLSAISGISQLPAEAEQDVAPAPRHGLSIAPDPQASEIQAPDGQASADREPAEQAMAPVVSLADARRRRASRALIAVAAAVALIAVAAGGWAVNLNQQLQNQQAGQVVAQQRSQRESKLLRAPDAKIYTSTLKDGSAVSYVVSKQQNAAVLIGGNVASPGTGKVYQIWTVKGFKTSDPTYFRDATFGAGDQRSVFLTTNVGQANALGISIEPTGSTPSKPTTTPFALASL